MATVVYSALHFLVDFICAYGMFGRFIPGDGGYSMILIYNFCAFALQMPLGAALDLFRDRSPRLSCLTAAAGTALTILGAMTHPAVLGLGNALFHVGGGVSTIAEDHAKGHKGAALGIFVAPGALGLYLGTLLGSQGDFSLSDLILPGIVLCLLTIAAFSLPSVDVSVPQPPEKAPILTILCCFFAVILRSWVGMSVSFDWKSVSILSLLAILGVVLGKMAGGIFPAKWGAQRTVIASLLPAAGCYLLGGAPAFGIAAGFFFNMTMPITLYQLVRKLPQFPGFSFGLLTFGLFLGFLPVYFDLNLPASGTLGSLVTLLILLIPLRKEARDGISA